MLLKFCDITQLYRNQSVHYTAVDHTAVDHTAVHYTAVHHTADIVAANLVHSFALFTYLLYSVTAARFTVLEVYVAFSSEIRWSPVATKQVKPTGEFSYGFHIHHWTAIHHNSRWVYKRRGVFPHKKYLTSLTRMTTVILNASGMTVQ